MASLHLWLHNQGASEVQWSNHLLRIAQGSELVDQVPYLFDCA